MNSLILHTITRFLASLLLLASIFLLWRGHNHPGGGFAGGLLSAAAFVLAALAFGPSSVRERIRIGPERLMAVGLFLAASAALAGPIAGDGFFQGEWVTLTLGDTSVKVGSPLLFDVGVYLTVIGVSLTIILSLMEED